VRHRRILLVLYTLQWVLCVGWNVVFFKYRLVLTGLCLILSLTVVIGYFLFGFRSTLKGHSLWVLPYFPYFLWLLVVSSLNAYIFIYN
jgi:benzodiazapine receptor